MKNVVQKLIESNHNEIIIVECGHGALLSNSFLSEKGASDLVLVNKQPYSKEIQAIEYPKNKGLRSVSKEFVRNVMVQEFANYSSVFRDNKVPICLATSFQLGGDNSICHGYFGIGEYLSSETQVYKIFHITIYQHNVPKDVWIDNICTELLNIVNNELYDGNNVENCHYIDGVWTSINEDTIEQDEISTLSYNIHTLSYNTQTPTQTDLEENFVCFAPDMSLIRFEDFVRLNKTQNKGVILQKGSYHPFHRAHKNIAENAKNAYPDYPHALVLSSNTCDKGKNTPEVLLDRIIKLTNHGYYVIVTKSGMFSDNIDWIRRYYINLNIIFPVGEDTIERFFRDWDAFFSKGRSSKKIGLDNYFETFSNVEWYITKRESETKCFNSIMEIYLNFHPNHRYSDLEKDEISSTKIRQGEITNDL